HGWPLQIDQIWKDEIRLRSERIGLTKTHVMLEKEQGCCIDEDASLRRRQIGNFREREVTRQQLFFRKRAKALWIAARFEHNRRAEVVEKIGRQEDVHRTGRGAQALHVTMVLKVAYRRLDLGFRKVPALMADLKTPM